MKKSNSKPRLSEKNDLSVMNTVKKNIVSFLEKQTCATVCCKDENGDPYCFSCYYVYCNKEVLLHFKSSADSHHSQLLAMNPEVAGTILPNRIEKFRTTGIQWKGKLLQHSDPLAGNAVHRYHSAYPAACAIKGTVFSILLTVLKMTDNKLVYGKKTYWLREEQKTGQTNPYAL